LRDRGVEYVEVRCLDLDPFVHVGIDATTLRFLDVFLLHCLLDASPDDTPDEIAALARNQERVAARGREPGLRLERGTSEVDLVEWGHELLDEFEPIAAALDALHDDTDHRDGVRHARETLADPEQLSSARMLKEMATHFGGSFVHLIRERSRATRRALLDLPWPDAEAARFRTLSEASLREQHALEAMDENVPFETFREQYLSPARLQPSRG
jgi:glutamate--cysteine ligase